MDAAMNATAAAMDGTVVPDGMNTSMASMAGHDHILFYCDGSLVTTPGGSWIGHCWPGIIMFVWGLHWTLGTFRNYFDSLRNKNEVYTAQSWLPLIGTPKHLPLEPICKVLLPPIAVALELYFAHAAGWRTLMCPPGTARAGHFFGAHINNWQHAAMYPGFWISGFVDLIALKVDLPKGTTHVFLSMGFFLEALLMGLHKKHFPLDIMVHELMFYAMMATAVCIFIEIIWPHNLLVTCSRLLSIFLQATWFWSVARIMFEHRPAWDVSDGDMAPVGLAPVLFTVEIWMIGVCLFGVYMAFSLFYSSYYGMSTAARDPESLPSSHYEKAGLLSDDDHRDNDKQQRVIPMSLIIKDKY